MKLYMGCGSSIRDNQIQEFENTGLYVAEPKFDGIFGGCVSNGSQKLFSRNGKEKILKLPSLPPGTIVVGELGYGSQVALERRATLGHDFMDVTDILQVDSLNVSQEDDNQRRQILESAWDSWSDEIKSHFLLSKRVSNNFKSLFDSEDEGIVLKKIKCRSHSSYQISSYNPNWFKCKKELAIDLVIMGYTISKSDSFQGLAQSVKCGVFKNGQLIHVCSVGSLDTEMRSGLVRSWPDYDGKVIEVKGYKVFSSGHIRHPSIGAKKIRDDKDPQECTWDSLMRCR